MWDSSSPFLEKKGGWVVPLLIIAVAHSSMSSYCGPYIISRGASQAHITSMREITVLTLTFADGVRLLPSRDQDEVSHHRIPSIAADLHGGDRACAGQDQRWQGHIVLGWC